MSSRASEIDDRQGGDLERVVVVLRRRVGLIAACLLLTAAAAFGFSKQQTKEYTATASLAFDSNPDAMRALGLSPSNADTPSIQATRVKQAELGPTANRVARKLGKGVTGGQVRRSVSIEAQGESSIIDVTATSTSPRFAAKIANTYARQFVSEELASDRRAFAQAQRLVEKQYAALGSVERESVEGLALQQQAQSLEALSKLGQGQVEVIQAAGVPNSPTSPKVAQVTAVGALLGLLFGLGLAFLLERLNRQLREPEEAREAFGQPVLSTVPESKSIKASNEGTAAAELPFAENEAFRMLRASLRYFNVDDSMRSVLVTSHGAEVGKSTVAWNLARVAATSSKAVLVEVDLRNPTVANQHGLEQGPGLGEILTRQVGLDIAIQSKPVVAGGNGDNGGWRELDVIVAGAVPPNPAELIESQAMAELLSLLTERYELVVLDTAPVGVVSDCFPLLRKVDGVIGVARMGRSTRDTVERLRDQLDRLDAPTLGIVANGFRHRQSRKYGYDYGYYGNYPDASLPRPDAPPPPPSHSEPPHSEAPPHSEPPPVEANDPNYR